MHHLPALSSRLRKIFALDFDVAIEHQLVRLAHEALHRMELRVGGARYRILEIEFYVHSEQHPDPFAHRHPVQHHCGHWYFHRAGPSESAGFKGGSYQGLDLTIGAKGVPTGMLIRALQPVDDEASVEGPSLVVDQILRDLRAKRIAELMLRDKVDLELVTQSSPSAALSPPIFRSPRVGLNPMTQLNAPDMWHYLFADYRFRVDLSRVVKGREHLLLSEYARTGAVLEDLRMRPSSRWL